MLTCIGCGCNIPPRIERLQSARDALMRLPRTHFQATAPLYASEPWGIEDQPPFLNSAFAIDTEFSPEELLDALKALESSLGRVKRPRYGPREIDLDILIMGSLRRNGPRLTLPHPGLFFRSFAFFPCRDLFPGWIDDESNQSLDELSTILRFDTVSEKIRDTW